MEWRRCPNFPDYEVSEFGDLRRLTPGRGARVGVVLKPFIRDDGYPMYMPRRAGRTLHAKAHQLVAWAFLGPPPNEAAEVAHGDGNPANNHWSNLRWDSRSGNHADKVRHGTDARGEKHPLHKLTAEQVLSMRRQYGDRVETTFKALGEEFGVSQMVARRIVIGELWAHLPGAVPPKSRGRVGEANSKTSLTAKAVQAMRRRFAAGEGIADLAPAYGLGYEQTRRIIRGEVWSHVPGAIPAKRRAAVE